MRNLFLSLVFLALLTSCRDKCRNIEPAVGNPKIELIVVDSLNENVFDSIYNIDSIQLELSNGTEIIFEIDYVYKSLIFWFNKNNEHDIQHKDDYILKFNSSESETFSISYESREYNNKGYENCQGWSYEYVNLTHGGITYTRPYGSETITIKI